ncbi:MAG: DNA adenine methylase [Gemmataceae bacterium]|nr:DNA adenine methylase [Gemmataceae bacterium]
MSLMPPHLHFVEPYAGGLAVLLAKSPEGVSEVVNDLRGDLTNFWKVLQREETFERFRRRVEATPFSEAEWQRAMENNRHGYGGDEVDLAFDFFILCRQSLAGRMESFAPLSKTRTRRGMNEQASAWLNAVDGLSAVHARMKRVVILNRDALDVIREQDGPDTLTYADPPYVAETRSSREVYEFEMSRDDHVNLLDAVRGCRGKMMLSGYRSDLYDDALKGWKRHEFSVANSAAGGKVKRVMTECLYCNF